MRVEQIIRPTGLLDPEVSVRPVEGQIDDLISEIRTETEKKNKVLVTTLTKRMAEDLTDYMKEVGIRVKYLHSDIDTLERAEIIRICVSMCSMCWWDQPAQRGGWIFPRSLLWLFWMQIRKASYVRRLL